MSASVGVVLSLVESVLTVPNRSASTLSDIGLYIDVRCFTPPRLAFAAHRLFSCCSSSSSARSASEMMLNEPNIF